MWVALVAISTGLGVALADAADEKKANHATEKRAQPKSAAQAGTGRQKLEILIKDKGFDPDAVDVRKGDPVEFVFTRKTDKTCTKDVFVDTGLAKVRMALPFDKPITIKAQFPVTGVVKYGCSPGVFTGTVNVH